MNIHEEYRKRLRTAEEAVRLVKDGDWVDYSQCVSFPPALDRALAGRKGELRDVKLRGAISMRPVQVVEQDPEQESFTYNVWHCSGLDRKYLDAGRAYFSPMLFRHCGRYYERGDAPVDVAMVTVAPMDSHGYFSYGLTNCAQQELIDAADRVIVEVNPHMPYIVGLEADSIHVTQVDAIVENDEDFVHPAPVRISDIDRKIAANIFPHLQDGITLQLGIGGMPNALGSLIAESDLKDLGMHTELMSDGYLTLYQAGKITNERKELNRGKGIFGICNGSRELYDFLDHNISILSAPMHYINDPAVIRQFANFVSINGCLAVDLYGQVCSETAGLRQISGTGGQLDFVTGAFEAPHGKAFLATASTFTDRQGVLHSNILPHFAGGEVITTPRAQAPWIVTEYGAVSLSGKPAWQRAEAIISVAHPDFREELICAAEAQRIWRRSNKR